MEGWDGIDFVLGLGLGLGAGNGKRRDFRVGGWTRTQPEAVGRSALISLQRMPVILLSPDRMHFKWRGKWRQVQLPCLAAAGQVSGLAFIALIFQWTHR